MAMISAAEFDVLFGPQSQGESPEQRARTSSRIFVRSQDQLAEYTESSTGRRLSAWEAFQYFGIEVLREVIEYGSAILPATAEEPARTLRMRREALGLSTTDLAKATGLPLADIEDAENLNTRTLIRVLEKMAQALALQDGSLSFLPQAGGDELLAVRLREINSSQQHFSSGLVSRLCEAAWVIRKQYELKRWLTPSSSSTLEDRGFQPSANYGAPDYPAYSHGYFLARRTREILGIPGDQPIENLRELTEKELGIAVVQLDLPYDLAGATITNGFERGIALNVLGDNENVWIRRATLAHELGHLLWDPEDRLKRLAVDKYADLDVAPWNQRNFVEARANSFAVEFLAPQQAAVQVFEAAIDKRRGLRSVMETFGISFTTAKFHIWNGLDRKIELDSLSVEDYGPSDDWIGRESFTIDFFKPESVHISRRGLFAYHVVQAADELLITPETAATYLGCTVDEYMSHDGFIRDIYGA